MRILFVCLGNICRSPLAEGIFNAMVAQSSLSHSCDSAGTAAYHIGELPDHRSRLIAQNNGITLTHRARQIRLEDFSQFDYIIAMDRSNYQDIIALQKKLSSPSQAQVVMMRQYDTASKHLDVPDPYYGTEKDFEEVYEILHRCLEKFLTNL
ncbi:MAG: low molecular weight phosphotyrosine protein phosphatase [Cytophagales bacterium]|nr:MAG: low molecular weight phosphotyrosine protein phosphatase [Cytophagales bacterium]